MARDFSKVSPSVWQSSRFRNLANDDARYLYLYFLTSEHQNSAGAFRLPQGYALVDLDWDAQRFELATAELKQADMITADPDTDEYRICRWFKHNPPMNEKHRKGIIKVLEKLVSETLCEEAVAELQNLERSRSEAKGQPKPHLCGDVLEGSLQLNPVRI